MILNGLNIRLIGGVLVVLVAAAGGSLILLTAGYFGGNWLLMNWPPLQPGYDRDIQRVPHFSGGNAFIEAAENFNYSDVVGLPLWDQKDRFELNCLHNESLAYIDQGGEEGILEGYRRSLVYRADAYHVEELTVTLVNTEITVASSNGTIFYHEYVSLGLSPATGLFSRIRSNDTYTNVTTSPDFVFHDVRLVVQTLKFDEVGPRGSWGMTLPQFVILRTDMTIEFIGIGRRTLVIV